MPPAHEEGVFKNFHMEEEHAYTVLGSASFT